MNVIALPTRASAEQAWDRYVALVRKPETDRALLTDVDHNIAVARAWAEWRDLFLALDGR